MAGMNNAKKLVDLGESYRSGCRLSIMINKNDHVMSPVVSHVKCFREFGTGREGIFKLRRECQPSHGVDDTSD